MDRQLLYLIGAALVLGILYLGLRYLLPLVLPFAFGAFLALMLEPVVNLLQVRARIPRPLATGITIISAVAVTVLVVVLLSASVAVDVKEITYRLPVYSNSMIKMLQEWAAQTEAFYGHLPGPLLQAVEEGVLRLYGLAGNMLGKLLGSLGALPNLILNLVLSFIAAYFVSKDRDRLGDFVRRTLPPKGAQHFQTLMQDVLASLVGLVWAQLILVTITTLVAMAGLWLLGIPHPIFIGLISGLLDIIPVLGPGLVFIPWAGLALVGGDPAVAIGLLSIYLAMIIIRQLLQIKIIGSHTGLHPLAVLVSLYVGVKLFGSTGIIVGPFILILFRSLLRLEFFSNLIKCR